MSRDQTMPDGRWEFDEEVTDVFDDMLERSIPQYEVMRAAVDAMASRFVRKAEERDEDPIVVDLGCSRGGAIARLATRFPSATFLGFEVSDPMVKAATERFEHRRNVLINHHDLRGRYPTEPNATISVTLCVLALQFIPIEHRQRIIRDIYRSTSHGGALILVEKVLGADADLDQILVNEYLSLKRFNGYSPEAIERKRLSLEGVLVPVTASWNEELLRREGFASVDCFWRWMNFAAWVAVKR